ncbi:hypothetical protein K437DRAFT_270564 [Tilletiaria anomala UBC 951]|uniref:NYN domain-containing protein n=1 Tax=Tilletiaria anomala (strain ATCC 24038 / CBS 436.72 / UBC 951) TaxID=1037660 RepID=A0A066VAH0_TILAU|nr:uncharacterized protein K437DRAFT_270564 [Tilletiaria anomala UBC 951]KDN38451.1 hypothetical protein K437DRAFT_270564 [Tilletiaria anomala UBC 951]
MTGTAGAGSSGGGGFLHSVLSLPAAKYALAAGVGTLAVGTLLYSTGNLGSISSSPSTSKSNSSGVEKSVQRRQNGRKSGGGKQENKQMVCSIFWDVDNCSPPSGFTGREVAQAIRKAVQETVIEDEAGGQSRGGTIVSFKAYLELSTAEFTPNASVVQLRSELQGSGVSLIDTPKSGRKNASDFMLAADMLTFALDVLPPARIFLVSGDRDFAYSLGTLRNRGYEVVLIVPPVGATPILQASANKVLRWRQDVLKVPTDASGRSYTTAKDSTVKAPASDPPSNAPDASQTNAVSSIVPSSSRPKTTPPLPSSTLGSFVTSNISVINKSPPSKHNDLVREEDNSQQQIDEVFTPLIEVLHFYAKEGNKKPLRSATAVRLVTSYPKVYERAGATRWAEYAAVAEANGLVVLGSDGFPGSEWIALTALAEPKPTPTPSTVSKVDTSKPLPQQHHPQQQMQLPGGLPSLTSSTITHTGSDPGKPTNDANGAARARSISSASKLDAATIKLPKGDRPIEVFFPLIEVHRSIKTSGTSKPLATEIATQLMIMERQGIADVYRQAGVSNWEEYIALAEQTGVARLREPDTGLTASTVQIHPRYSELYTSQVTASAARIVDTTVGRNDNALKPNAAAAAKSSKQSAANNPSLPAPDGTAKKYRNIRTASYDPKAKGQNIYNGHTFPEEFTLLVIALLDQREEGRFYSVDAFLHKLLYRLGQKDIKKVDEFNAFLKRAEDAKVIEIQPGFSASTKHIRLHSCFSAASKQSDRSFEHKSNEDKNVAISEQTGNRFNGHNCDTSSHSSSARSEDPTFEAQVKVLWSAQVSSEDDVRFWPLAGTLAQIYEKEGAVVVSRSRLSGEVPKRFPLQRGASGSTGAWYQAHNVSGFWEYATLAAQKGYVDIVRNDGRGHEGITLSAPLSPASLKQK